MKAMLLAAGVGERMRPLTDHTPKPLLRVGGVPLLERHIRRLADAGVTELVINVSHLGQQVMDYCGSGERWGVRIAWSCEETPLETAGGIVKALPLLGEQPFAIINGDVWTQYPFEQLTTHRLAQGLTAHLVMVDNPPQHPLGDFVIDGAGTVRKRSAEVAGLTYAGIGIYTAQFFTGIAQGKLALRPLLDTAIDRQLISAEHYRGAWEDVGTPERLRALNARVNAKDTAKR
tara:strand:- start:45495 stop:46190 length:696 start_codon:yes stop_codon:yes gene_type:complete